MRPYKNTPPDQKNDLQNQSPSFNGHSTSQNSQPRSNQPSSSQESSSASSQQNAFQAPAINLPKGGGAIQGIGEKFQANPVTGTGSMTVPIAMSQGRGGFTPQLTLSYDSGAGNSCFGLGWNIGLPRISRKTQKGLPQYDGLPKYEDAFESDVFLLSGAEDLVPVIDESTGKNYVRKEGNFKIFRYRPRIEGLFARIEKWANMMNNEVFWKSITKENITTIYGKSAKARVGDPQDESKVFEWKIEESFDDRGNVIIYQYKKEDGKGFDVKPIYEKNRNDDNAYSQIYCKRIFYGNTIPHHSPDFDETEWLFELVFDYGEHEDQQNAIPSYQENRIWEVRPDIFSSFRSGFDIRTYRLCRRILMFHHFEEKLGEKNYLVKATHLEFEKNSIVTQLKQITHTGYRIDQNGDYVSKSYPPVSFKYSIQKIDKQVYNIESDNLQNAPQGIDGQGYQFNDLFGEGLSGILKQDGTAWYYKRNLGNGKFSRQQVLPTVPSVAANANIQIADFGGDGLTDVLVQTETLNGYFELSEEAEWSKFKVFPNPTNFNLNDPSLRMIDLDGNGIPDLLLTESDCFVWYAADAKDGYKAARRVAKVLDEEQGAKVVFNEKFQTIFLADMTGDGLTDIVRIRNTEICYWANLGFGQFSAKVTMADAPHFDFPDYFDPKRIRLGDIDGSGSTDVLYLGRTEIKYWLSQSGNSWSEAKMIEHFPKSSNLHTVSLFDLLGNGTSCIVWSSPLPAESGTPMKYIQLMGNSKVEGNKPYLLREVDNNMGAITRLKYESSTKFYLEDSKQGLQWITKLPFPIQVLVRQEVYDEITGNHFVSRYAYHHGNFDRIEREFRGFGMVEQWDTEDYETLSENTLFQHPGKNWTEEIDIMPPVYTKTWFHTGYYREGGKITRQYEKEYYAEDEQAWFLSDTELPEDLIPFERREAARAFKGKPLRVEVYGRDEVVENIHPYTVAETKYHVKTIQKKGSNRYACFYVCECETLNYQYERNPSDPRIAHETTLEIDEFGNVTKSASIVYPRRGNAAFEEQKQIYTTYTEADFINKKEALDYYRIGTPFAQRTYELTGLNLEAPFEKEALKNALVSASEIPFEQSPSGSIEKRLVTSSKTSFYSEDLSSELPFGDLAFHALPFQTYEAVYTKGLIEKFNKDGEILITAGQIENEAGFVPIDGLWWRCSNKAVFDKNLFYLPIRQIDPFGHPYEMGYDPYQLAMIETSTKVYGKSVRSTALVNYRTLQVQEMTDPNGNRSEVLFDALGMITATSLKGKNGEGDTLDDFIQMADPNRDMRADMQSDRLQFLQNATSLFYYDVNAWRRDNQPNYAISIVRETHVSEENGTPSKTQFSCIYSDGLGQNIMTKIQAEPGDAFRLENGQVINDFASSRWVGNGRTVFNNKGNPVKEYEPYFSHTFNYETEKELVEYGVSPEMTYDPLGRNIRTDLPDGSFMKVEFTPWQQITFDRNDTVLESQWFVERGSPYPSDSEPNVINNPNNYDRRAAWLAAHHAYTPKKENFDILGRIFLLEDDNGLEGVYQTHFKLDIQGNQVEMWDAKGRLISRNHFNMVQEPICTESMDAGRRWMLTNIMGNPAYQWNDRNFQTRFSYDELQRNIATFLKENEEPEQLVYFTVFGETLDTPETNNHFGQPYQLYDQAGCTTSIAFDFKTNPVQGRQQVCVDYKNRIDWMPLFNLSDTTGINTTAQTFLEAETFNTLSVYDALNRPLKMIAPDNSQTHYQYNEANLLEKIDTYLRGANNATSFVKNINYDSKGQRTKIQYGNGVTGTYEYDPATFRLQRMRCTRISGEVLQDMQYHYDPEGNITSIRDNAQQTIFFANQLIEPHCNYIYDALYRLKKAEGREHIGQSSQSNNPLHFEIVTNANDGQAMRRYLRSYHYDQLGNILKVNHQAGIGTNFQNSWERTYNYDAPSFIQANEISNHLSQIQLNGISSNYTHDIHGNMTSMTNLSEMIWDYEDQLKEVYLGGGGRQYYTYSMAGEKDFGVRMRKVTEKPGGIICDRVYIGGFEVYRERKTAGNIELERESLHMQDDTKRIALIETLTIENSSSITSPSPLMRFQLSNHLGSSCLELDEDAALISYEEYYAFGGSSYRAGRSFAEASLKRYRYVGKERDEETGLDQYGARYYASWFCRFVSVDRLKDKYPFYTPFQYAGNKPISFFDLDGKEEEPSAANQDEIKPYYRKNNSKRFDETGLLDFWPSDIAYIDEPLTFTKFSELATQAGVWEEIKEKHSGMNSNKQWQFYKMRLGRIFEDAVLRDMDRESNQKIFYNPMQPLDVKGVKPDATAQSVQREAKVGPKGKKIYHYYAWDYGTFIDAKLTQNKKLKFKPTYNPEQLKTMIDVLSSFNEARHTTSWLALVTDLFWTKVKKNAAKNEAAHLHIITLAGVTIDEDLIQYAKTKKVNLLHSTVTYSNRYDTIEVDPAKDLTNKTSKNIRVGEHIYYSSSSINGTRINWTIK